MENAKLPQRASEDMSALSNDEQKSSGGLDQPLELAGTHATYIEKD